MTSVTTFPLYEEDRHAFLLLGWEEQEEEGVVQTNQYLLTSGDEAVLFDPGGAHVFPQVLANVAERVDLASVRHIVYSHQDPDVSSGITLWLSIAPRAQVHISGLWTRFLPHFGIYDQKRITAIADQGGTLTLKGGDVIDLIPAHFLHSTGQFCAYDRRSKILFSGDIGAAIFPPGKRYPLTEDFAAHVRYMEGFHRRYMASNVACRRWADLVSRYDVQIIAPQHGAVLKGPAVKAFLDWFRELRCGVDTIDDWFGKGPSALTPGRTR
jgi:flavorubredoxin